MPSDFFDEAIAYLEDGKPKKALKTFNYIVKKYPKNDLAPRSYYNVGVVNYQMEKYMKAQEVFNVILKGNYNETEALGGGIMDNPYANYKHRATNYLQLIHYQKEDYDSSLYYLSLSDTLYPYIHFCGNELSYHEIQKSLTYADLYLKLDEVQKAKNSLANCFLDDLSDNSIVLEEYKKILSSQENSTKLITELDASLENITSISESSEDYTFTWYSFTFQGSTVPIPKYLFIRNPYDKKETVALLKKTDFYKMIQSL
jgi:tetratricopeptide (TPR) repeat protein